MSCNLFSQTTTVGRSKNIFQLRLSPFRIPPIYSTLRCSETFLWYISPIVFDSCYRIATFKECKMLFCTKHLTISMIFLCRGSSVTLFLHTFGPGLFLLTPPMNTTMTVTIFKGIQLILLDSTATLTTSSLARSPLDKKNTNTGRLFLIESISRWSWLVV